MAENSSEVPAERQLRPLAPLEPEQQREAWKEAVDATGGKPTAADVKQAAKAKVTGRPQPTRIVRDADSQDTPDYDGQDRRGRISAPAADVRE